MAALQEAFHGGGNPRNRAATAAPPRTSSSVLSRNEARNACLDLFPVDDPTNLVSSVSIPRSFCCNGLHATAAAAPGNGEIPQHRNNRRIHHHHHAFASLPVLCRDRTKNLVSKFGFVVTRRSRTLSLDDQSIFPSPHDSIPSSSSSRMRKFASRDDSCIPLMQTLDISQLKKDLLSSSAEAAAAAANLSSVRRDLSDRSQSFDCRNYDLVGSLPGPKFLLLDYRDEQDSSAGAANGSSSFKAPASIPFKWEIAPGLPKPEAAKPEPCLQLPPRLLVRSFTTRQGVNSPSHQQQQRRRASSVNNRQSLLLGIRSASSSCSSSSSPGPAAAAGASEAGKVSPSSPTSVFGGPSSSYCSSSECCDSDSRALVLVSDAESGISAAAAAQQYQQQLQLQQQLDDDADLGPPKSSLGESIARIFSKGRAKFRKNSRRKKDVEMWAPTLAAYFTTESTASSSSSPNNSQLVLLEDEQVEVPGESVESNELLVNGVTHCGCASPGFTPFSPKLRTSLKRLGAGKQKKWVATRIRRSSKVLQTFVFKAVKLAVHARPKS